MSLIVILSANSICNDQRRFKLYWRVACFAAVTTSFGTWNLMVAVRCYYVDTR